MGQQEASGGVIFITVKIESNILFASSYALNYACWQLVNYAVSSLLLSCILV